MPDETPGDVPDAEEITLPLPSGTVVTAEHAVPLGGVLVRWSTVDARGRPAVELGRAVTDADGAFLVTAGLDRESRAAQCSVQWAEEPRSVLLVGEHVSVDVGADVDPNEPLVLRMDGEHPPADDAWSHLAEHLAATGTIGTGAVVAHLLQPPADSPLVLWDPAERAAAVDRVAAVQPTGRTDPADPTGPTLELLLDAAGLVDLTALGRGDVGAAITTYLDVAGYVESAGWRIGDLVGSGSGATDLGTLFPDVVGGRSDVERYRDYLRGVWVTAGTAMYGWYDIGRPVFRPTETQLVDQLERRFHQSFRTRSTAARPVHELLLPILRDALTTPVDHGGWGLPTLPDRGDATDAEYLAVLVGLSGVDTAELRNRYRVRFDRAEEETASAVELNVEALLGLLADTWQAPIEPFVVPMRGLDPYRPFLTHPHAGRAPFFLQYEEWLERQRPFFPENVYDVRTALPEYPQALRETFERLTTDSRTSFTGYGYSTDVADLRASASWVVRLMAAVDTIREALTMADRQNHRGALRRLEEVHQVLVRLALDHRSEWRRDEFLWWSGTSWNDPAERRVSLTARAGRRVRTAAELRALETWFQPPERHRSTRADEEFAVARMRTLGIYQVEYLLAVALPWLRADVHVALGDPVAALAELSPATRFPVGVADAPDPAGYRRTRDGRRGDSQFVRAHEPVMYRSGHLPYTTGTTPDRRRPGWFADVDGTEGPRVTLELLTVGERSAVAHLPAWERRALRLAQGDVALDLAEQVLRRDDPSSARRARELAKGVVLMHGHDPGTLPRWQGGWTGWLGTGAPSALIHTNPAVDVQVARARRVLALVEAGLNAYGYHPDMVPVLRFAVHEGAARSFATAARAAQADLLAWTTRFEEAQVEEWRTTAMVTRGEAALTIAQERTEIARAGVAKAEQQVTAVEAQIAAKKKEIEERGSILGQFTDFLSGVKESMEGMVSSAQMLDGASAGADGAQGAAAKAASAKGMGGTAAAKDAVVAKLGAGAGMAFAFGAFAYAGIMGIKGLGEAARRRDSELTALRETALPAARDGVRLAERDVTIGEAEQLIARTDLDLARTLATFQQERFLSVALWNQLTRFAQRTMRRYVELAARHAWLAERALAYEQLREVRVVGLDYAPAAVRGLTGPDRLLLDLAELVSDRLLHQRQRVPVQHTVSLARDLPLAFGALKATGRCTFRTDEDDLRRTYPGLWGLRLVHVGARTEGVRDGQARGVLRNLGVSTVSRADGTADVVVRYPETQAVSELELPRDALLHGVPGETLLGFEGSGVTTDWELELPADGNPRGLGDLTDVVLTLDLRAQQGDDVVLPVADGPRRGALLLAASAQDPVGLGSLYAESGPARVTFDLRRAGLPRAGAGAVLVNLALVTVGRAPASLPVTVRVERPTTVEVAATLTDGVAMSTGGVLAGEVDDPTPLTALVGAPLDQPIVVEIAQGDLSEEVRALHDVVLLVEHETPSA